MHPVAALFLGLIAGSLLTLTIVAILTERAER